ncbi:YcaO-like family protein [Candidatus Entotheonella palauensis]|uniref:YcaO-like family protein n=1 Tax=Candidatus Entotheonella palauensis TaxID=93172 RepID=UPI000B7F01B0|nr:YcaO-like family protein [Candidatus Entotheonella palauensis]
MSHVSQTRFSSLREVPARTTLARAKAWADMAGISRVTDITRLGPLGVPVFASIRPRSSSTPVTYGKGLLPIDAQVGAYMEAIEFYFAEPRTGSVITQWGTPKDISGSDRREDIILDFSPRLRQQADLNGPLLLAVAHDVEQGHPCLVPAELVHYPAADVGQALFGSSTNGLASGNSVPEANLHALLEVIERDIWSFQFIQDTSVPVDSGSLPPVISEIVARAEWQGSILAVRYVPNDYGLAFFSAFLFDPENLSTKFFNGGWGCHPNRDIALVRAVCEVAQSRLAFIHGARDFVSPPFETASQEAERVRQQANHVLSREPTMSYSQIPNWHTKSPEHAWTVVVDCLRRVTNMPIYGVVYTPPEAPLQVVRVIVPSLEDFKEAAMRVGRRFKARLESYE